jgi:hypothetical protein
MSNPFKLPMICEHGDGYIYSQDCRYSIRFDDTDINCLEQKEFVASAINSHDKLVEQNKTLREALEILKDATEHTIDESLVIFMAGGVVLNYDAVIDIVDKALEATK